MAIELTSSPRKIMFNGQPLTDINEALSVSDVVAQLAHSNPALTNTTIEGPKVEDGVRIYTVKARVGNKG